jgi:hypothetical protein
MSAKYDVIGENYAELRKPDPRIAQVIEDALGPCSTSAPEPAPTSLPTGR